MRMESTRMNTRSDNTDPGEPSPLQNETFRHDMSRWGTKSATQCDLGMGQASVDTTLGCGLIIEDNSPRPNWNSPANPVTTCIDNVTDENAPFLSRAQRMNFHEASHNIPGELFNRYSSTHQPEPYITGPRHTVSDRESEMPNPNEKREHPYHSIEPFPAPSVKIAHDSVEHTASKLRKIEIPLDSEHKVGEIDSNFFKGSRYSDCVTKEGCSVTTPGDKHWDVAKGSNGKTTYARIQEPLPDGSGYRVTEYRSPFRDSQLLGCSYEVDNEGRVKRSSLETLQLDASLRLAKNNLSATVDFNGNLSVSVPSDEHMVEVTRLYYRNGTEMDSFLNPLENLSVSAKYRTYELGQRETTILPGHAKPSELPYMLIESALKANDDGKVLYMYDTVESNYYCTQGPETGSRFDLTVQNGRLVRRPVPRSRH